MPSTSLTLAVRLRSRASTGHNALRRRLGARRLGGLHTQNRRNDRRAADIARGIFFGGFRSLGRIAPTVFMMSAPSGKPSGLPFPVLRSANLLGAALPLAGEDGSQI
jgi:hypothetical protein